MFKLEDGWVGQDQFERCSNLEIPMEKWTLPNPKNLTHGNHDIVSQPRGIYTLIISAVHW